MTVFIYIIWAKHYRLIILCTRIPHWTAHLNILIKTLNLATIIIIVLLMKVIKNINYNYQKYFILSKSDELKTKVS